MTTHKPAVSARTPGTPGIGPESGNIRDPFILSDAAGSTYWLYGSRYSNIWSGPGTGFDGYRSPNLVDWARRSLRSVRRPTSGALANTGLDGTLFIDDDGAPWIVFHHECVQVRDGGVVAQRLSDDLRQAVGNPIYLSTPPMRSGPSRCGRACRDQTPARGRDDAHAAGPRHGLIVQPTRRICFRTERNPELLP